MGACHLQTGIGLESRYGEIECRRRQHSYIDRGAARLRDPPSDAARKRITAGTVVPANCDHRRAAEPVVGHAAEGAPQGSRELRGELAVDETTNVILAKNGFGNVHVV